MTQTAIDAMTAKLIAARPDLASRADRAARIALAGGVERLATGEWGVQGSSGYYVVSNVTSRRRECQCKDFEFRGGLCCHILAVLLVLRAPDYEDDADWTEYAAIESAGLTAAMLCGKVA